LQAKAKAKASAKAVAKAKAKVRALATVHKCAPPSVKIIMGGFPCKDACPLNIHMDTQAVENVSRQTGVVWKAILAWINAHPETEFGIFENAVGLDNIGKKQRQVATAKAKLRAAKANTKAQGRKEEVICNDGHHCERHLRDRDNHEGQAGHEEEARHCQQVSSKEEGSPHGSERHGKYIEVNPYRSPWRDIIT
jgi:hypothetical protein